MTNTSTKAQLIEAIAIVAKAENATELETITAMQAGAALLSDGEATLGMLIEIKREMLEEMGIL